MHRWITFKKVFWMVPKILWYSKVAFFDLNFFLFFINLGTWNFANGLFKTSPKTFISSVFLCEFKLEVIFFSPICNISTELKHFQRIELAKISNFCLKHFSLEAKIKGQYFFKDSNDFKHLSLTFYRKILWIKVVVRKKSSIFHLDDFSVKG